MDEEAGSDCGNSDRDRTKLQCGDGYRKRKRIVNLIENNRNMELTEELKTKMIEALNLEEMTPADIDDNAPLFGDEGLGLDSIDVLELIVLLERNYGIKIADPKQGKEIFASVRTMADYVAANRTK